MPLVGALRSRVVSWLRPWLRAEPDVELKLGFLGCQATCRDLDLDPARLDPLIDASTRLAFRRVTVGELSLRFSPWPSPSLHVSVRGFHVVLAPRDSAEGSSWVMTGDSDAEENTVKINSIDPEGALLRGMLENALKTTSSGGWLRTSLTETLLRRCRVQFQDVCFQLQFAAESNACLLKARELNVQPRFLDQGGASRGVFFMSKKESFSLAFSCTCLEFGLKENDLMKILVSSSDPCVRVRLTELRPTRFDILFPLMESGFSPLDIPIILLVLDLFSGQPKRSRNGKVLWRIAARRISLLSHHPRGSLHKLASLVLLWLSYVHAYETLLSLVGYSDENMFKELFVNMCDDLEFKSLVQNQLRVVDELEKQLPVEAVGRARQIARQRVLLCPHISVSESAGLHMALKGKLFVLLSFIWKVVYFLFHIVANVMLTLRNVFNPCQRIEKMQFSPSRTCFNASAPQNCVNLTIGEFHISLHPISVARATSKAKSGPDRDISQMNLSPIFLSMKYFCLIHCLNRIERSFFLVLGEFQIHLSPSSRVPLMESELELETTPSFRVPRAETGDSSQVILWTEPAHLLCSPAFAIDSKHSAIGIQATILENCLQEMCSSWKLIGEELEGDNFHWMGNPFFLFESRNFFISPSLSKTVGRALRCNLALGKVNFDLEYSSIVSFAQLLRQLLDSVHWMANMVKPHFPSSCCSIIKERKKIKLEEQLEICACRLKVAMLNMMPENNIQVGAMIAGPAIRISLHRFTEKDSTHALSSFSLYLEGIEVAVWPASRATLLALNPGLELEAIDEYVWLQEPQIGEIPKGQMNESFLSRGRISHNMYMGFSALTAFFENLEDNQRSQVLGPIAMKINASTCRHYLHSFYSTTNVCSLSVSMVAGEADVLLYMDELCTLFQVLEGILPIASTMSVHFDYAVLFTSREFIRKFISVKRDTISNQMAVGEEGKTVCLKSTQFTIHAHLEFGHMYAIVNSSRKTHLTMLKTDNASSSATSYHNQLLLNLPDFGLGIFLQKSCIQVSCNERHVKLLMDLLDIRTVIFKPQREMDIFSDSIIKDVHHHSRHLCEFLLSPLILYLSAGNDGDLMDSASGSEENASSSTEPAEKWGAFLPFASKSVVQSHVSHCGFPLISVPVPGFYFITEIELGEIFIADCSMKSLVTGQHQPSRSQLLISSRGGFHTINFESQGGCFFLETSSLTMSIQSLKAYLLCLSSLQLLVSKSSSEQCEKAGALVVLDGNVPRPSTHHRQEYSETIECPTLSSETWKLWFFQSLDASLSQFSVTFAVTDGSGVVQCLTLEADVNLRLMSLERNLSFNLLNLTVLSQHLQKKSMPKTEIDLTPFCSRIPSGLPMCIRCGPPRGVSLGLDNAESSSAVSQREISLDSDESGLSPLNHLNYILKHLYASIMLKKTAPSSEVATLQLKSGWSGSGSISGFDLTISLSEIQMLLALFAPLAGMSSTKSGKILKKSSHSQTQGWTNNLDFTIPDGAIVAIQDLHQHLYLAVEGVGIKYHVVGALHYSLVGERALFRVKWHKQKRSLFSLTSLHAKNVAGEPLRLNCHPGSGFVEISSSDDRGQALWKILPYKAENYGDDHDMEFYGYCTSARKVFHLVNHKNNSGVAFLDGRPEFVQKPGSPFKLKVFHELTQAHDGGKNDALYSYTTHSVESNTQGDASCEDGNRSVEGSNLVHVDITIDRIVFTVCHEVSDADDKFPLVRCCIGNVHIIGQILHSKFRLICTHFVAVDYFNAQRNLWRKIISPVDACIFLRYRFSVKGLENVQKKVPAHYYFRIKQVDVSLTELSLDIILFVAGKLNVAGPYTLQSAIFCNCCKVENLSSLNLVCHFSDNQDALVAGKQSTSVFLRKIEWDESFERKRFKQMLTKGEEVIYKCLKLFQHERAETWRKLWNCTKYVHMDSSFASCNDNTKADMQLQLIFQGSDTSLLLSLSREHPEIKSSVSIYASENSGFSTLPFHVSLSSARVVAWRTCVISKQDSRTFFGPSLVVEVSKKTEGGLSLVVSPLSRIHNVSGFSMELRLCTPQETNVGSTTIALQVGDTIDDSTPLLSGLDSSGGLKRAMTSLSEGNFLLSLKPDISGFLGQIGRPISVDWSEDMIGKPISVDWSEDMIGGRVPPLSGIFDKLSHRFMKAFGVASMKSSLSTVRCPLILEDRRVSDIHFLIQIIGKDVPIIETPNVGDTSETEASQFTFQKEIFISPTVQVSNLLQTDILVVLSETFPDPSIKKDCDDIGKNAIIPCGSSAYFYANPALICFVVSLTAFNSKCKPVDSSECVKKLHKQKAEAHYFDIELDFGKYFAYLRLSCGGKGILEATVFTPYTLQNDTELFLFCSPMGQKTFSREENEKNTSIFPPELGTFLPPKSMRSWFLKYESNKVRLRLMVEKASESLLDLDTLSGFTELCLESCNEAGVSHIAKIVVSLKPFVYKAFVPAQLVSIVPRYVISNESMEPIIIRQCDLENDADVTTQVESKQKAILYVHANTRKRSTTSLFDSVFRKHRNIAEDSLVFIQFRLKEIDCSWSGPICISSLGRFFMKFKSQPVSFISGSNAVTETKSRMTQFASVYIAEESSTLVLHFHMPPDLTLPYRIENCLHGASITYHQKDSGELETLGSGNSVEYVWDDLTLPHKLVIQISGIQIFREINIDKICTWKPFFKTRQNKLFTLHSPLNRMSGFRKRSYGEPHEFEILRLGYEVYADGLTRVLRICEFADSYKGPEMLQPHAKIQFRVGSIATSLHEHGKQDEVSSVPQVFVVARLQNVTLDSLSTDQYTYFCARAKLINVDNKWQGAPFASMVRRSQLHDSFLNEDMLRCFFILHANNSSVKQVKRFSLVLQPIDLNLDEETLMKLASFWRTSLSDSKMPSQLYYFRQFEIHPLKIKASFLPGNPYSSYSSTQETLRSLLHSVIKVPAVKNTVIELNGVLLNHALVTKRELLIKCAQHYSWYVVRAVYIAKGSPLLPPAFASIFDDAASSSLDVFFDPSDGSINLPGFTLGMFKFVSKCIDSKGFSGTKRYFGDLSKTMKKAGSNVLFAAITEISDSILKGAETDGVNGLVKGFHQGILRLAMEPSLLGAAVMQGGPDRKIILDHSPGVNELYIEGYLQAMLHVTYKQEYLQVKVTDNTVHLKNLPPSSSLINEIMENVKSFLISQGLLKGETSSTIRPPIHLRGESEWRIGPMILTLCEHLFVSFTIRILRKQADKLIIGIRSSRRIGGERGEPSHPSSTEGSQEHRPSRIWAVGSFVLSGMFAYVDGWLCRRIPNPVARRIVSGFLLTFLEKNDKK